jgi:hypothetical protein
VTQDPTILMCVGATKAGTSWLYRALFRHPECHLRTRKELHYFDTVETGNFDRQIGVTTRELIALEARDDRPWNYRARHRDLTEWLALMQGRAADMSGYLAYLSQHRADRRLVGDITPAYALLPADRLRQIASMAADVRFVYLLRDPVSRLWSHVRMLASRVAREGHGFAEAAFAALDRVLEGQDAPTLERGDYAGAIARLDAAVDPRRLLVMFQDDLMTRDGWVRLCTFLGIGPIEADFDRRVHAGVALDLAPDRRRAAARLLRPQYDFAARRFGTLPQSWQANRNEAYQ